MGRQKASLVRAAEAVTALRAMLADVSAFDETVLRRLALRATRPIEDPDRRFRLHESLMACLAGLLLSDFLDPENRAHFLLDAQATLDAIAEAARLYPPFALA